MNETQEWKRGWYEYPEGWFLTYEALQKEVKAKFGLDKRELAKVLLSTHDGYEHQGELRMKTRTNMHNLKWFTVYCLSDVEKIIEEEKEGNFKDFL